MPKEINERHPREAVLTRCVNAVAKWRRQQEVFLGWEKARWLSDEEGLCCTNIRQNRCVGTHP